MNSAQQMETRRMKTTKTTGIEISPATAIQRMVDLLQIDGVMYVCCYTNYNNMQEVSCCLALSIETSVLILSEMKVLSLLMWKKTGKAPLFNHPDLEANF
jgi:hypothetical protein